MNNDLISRSALKEYIQDNFNKKAYFTVKFIEAIDNAPTVELNDKSLEIARKSIELGRRVGKLEGKLERPQGEWNYIQAGMCVCPFCGAMPHKLYKNYCANCGADMRGDT